MQRLSWESRDVMCRSKRARSEPAGASTGSMLAPALGAGWSPAGLVGGEPACVRIASMSKTVSK